MRKNFIVLLLLLSSTAFCQLHNDQYSLEAGYGFGISGSPTTTSLTNFNAAFRYMVDDYWGLKFDAGFSRFEVTDSPVTGTEYTRISAQGVHNLGRTLNLRGLTNNSIGLLAHGGLGYSALKSLVTEEKDNIGNVIIGITPQIRLLESLALHADLSYILNFTQHYNFAGLHPDTDKHEAFTGHLTTFTLGLTYYFGRNGSSSDWK